MIVALFTLTPARAADPAPQPLGRLFLTPQARSQLEAQRQANVQVQTGVEPEAEKNPAPVEDPALTLNGLVVRGGGKSTLWVNGRPLPDGAQIGDLRTRINPAKPGTVRIANPAGSDTARAAAEVRVGQAVNRGTLETTDVVPPAAITIGPAAR